MYKNIIAVIVLSVSMFGCYDDESPTFESKIRNWQLRQRLEMAPSQTETIDDGTEMTRSQRLSYLREVLLSYQNIEYQSENGTDVFQTYNQTVKREYKGDCEDQAIYWYYILREEGLINDNDLILQIYEFVDGTQHTVLHIQNQSNPEEDNGFYISNNTLKYQQVGEIIIEFDLWAIYKSK